MNKPAFDSSSDISTDNDYRAVSKAAVASFVFAILGLTAFVSPIFVLLPLLGIIFGIATLLSFRRFGDELVGKKIGMIGFGLSLLLLIGSIGGHVYEYQTEVPDGYMRMSFADLQPGKRTSTPFSERAAELDGQKVFLKGYTRPGDRQTGLKNFILVGDFGECCFGGSPKITDIVAVEIIGDGTVDYGYWTRKVIGTFQLNKNARRSNEKDIPGVFYEIIADEVR